MLVTDWFIYNMEVVMSSLGKFIAIEGPDGSGKTTIINKLKKQFAGSNNVIFTREPGGTVISEKIRELLLDVNNTEITPNTEAYLYAAARVQHTEQLIAPSIRAGKFVISDRYVLASVCYQGYGRENDVELIKQLNVLPESLLEDDIYYIVLMVDAETGISRKKGQKSLDRMELEKIDFHKRVCAGYESYRGKKNYIFIDATKGEDEVYQAVLKAVEMVGVK